MLKKLLIVSCLVLVIQVAKADDGQKIVSKVQKVIVFLNGAQVTRTAMVNVSSGTTELVFGGISPGIDVQSIQVRANGEFTILSVKQEMNFIDEELKQKSILELQSREKELSGKIAQQNSLLSVYQEEENMLTKNQVVTGENASLDVAKLKLALDFQTQRLIELKQKHLAIDNHIADLNSQIQKYNKQIAGITKGNSVGTSNIRVTVSSKINMQTTFTLSYLVNNASWYPTYDIRAKDISSPLSIIYKANVSQQSGEDWKNIKLTLSTGNPTVSGNKPELDPYFLNFGMYYSDAQKSTNSTSGQVFTLDDNTPLVGVTIRVKGTSIGAVTDANGNFNLQTPPGNRVLVFSCTGYESTETSGNGKFIRVGLKPLNSQLNEVVVTGYTAQRKSDITGSSSLLNGQAAGVSIRGISTIPLAVDQKENQTNIEFDIDNPYSVPSDGKRYMVEIKQLDLKANYEYAVTPKLSTDVFLSARLSDWSQYNFLAGEANLFFEGTFIGKSLLNTNATNDTLNISLGVDKNIVVTRTSLKDITQKQSLGSNQKEIKDWQIEVKNRKSQAVNILVEDQIPVSQNSSIEVESQEVSSGKIDATTGKVSWSLNLKPQDDKKLELKYQVKYPKNQTVIVQ